MGWDKIDFYGGSEFVSLRLERDQDCLQVEIGHIED